MKNLLLFFVLAISSVSFVQAQAPQGINYQGVLRDDTGQPLDEQNIFIKFIILKNSATGDIVYSETHAGFTDQFGLFNKKIGEGQVAFGSFSSIDWGSAPHFLRVEVDPSGTGSNYQLLGTQQMVSVPYALYAEKSGSGGGNYVGGDGIEVVGNVITNTGDNDNDPNNEKQMLSISGNQLSLSNGGGTVVLPTGVTYNAGAGINIIGNSISATDDSNSNEIQSLSISGNQLSLSNGGGSVALPSGATYSAGNGITISGNTISSSTFQKSGSNVYYTGGNIGIGTSSPDADLTVNQNILGKNSSGNLYALGETTAGGGFFATYGGTNSNYNFFVSTHVSSSNNGYAAVANSSGTPKAGMFVDGGVGYLFADGANGGVKNFRMPHPTQPGKKIWYASIEGPEAAAYCRGTGTLTNGEGIVHFTEDFNIVANETTMTVMLTPLSGESKGLAVIEKTAEGFKVKELLGGTGNYSFDWEAKAVRSGHEGFRVVRDASENMPTMSRDENKN